MGSINSKQGCRSSVSNKREEEKLETFYSPTSLKGNERSKSNNEEINHHEAMHSTLKLSDESFPQVTMNNISSSTRTSWTTYRNHKFRTRVDTLKSTDHLQHSERSKPTTSIDETNSIVSRIRAETNYYAILGIPHRPRKRFGRKNDIQEEVKRSYRKCIRLVHPDNYSTGDTALAAKVNEAYIVLSDPIMKQKYDKNDNNVMIMYAKHISGEIYREFTSPFASHNVEWRELLEGDHVYFLMQGMYGAAHHGIVVRIGEAKEDIRIIDFGVEADGQSKEPDQENVNDHTNGKKKIRQVSLNDFLPEFRTLKRAEYGQTAANAYWKLVGAYRDTSSPPQLVLERAHRLCMLVSMEYDTFVQSCETVAFWCKTGKRYSGQADKFHRLLGTMYLYCRGTNLALWMGMVLCANASMLTESTGTVVTATNAAAGSMILLPLAITSGVCLLGFSAVALWKFMARRHLKHAQTLEVINLITKLQSRDRSDIISLRDSALDHDETINGLARYLDECAYHHDVEMREKPAIVSIEYQLHHYRHLQQNCCIGNGCGIGGTTPSDGTNFAIQVLLRCEKFNAMLDLPDPKFCEGPHWERSRKIFSTLREAEFYILNGRAYRVDGLRGSAIVSYHRDYNSDAFADDFNQLVFQFTATATLPLVGGGQGTTTTEVINLDAYKIGADFQKLHEVLLELHPNVQNIRVPGPLEENVGKYIGYLAKLIELSDHSREHGWSMESYLKTLQATEVREQVVAFLSTSSSGALEAMDASHAG